MAMGTQGQGQHMSLITTFSCSTRPRTNDNRIQLMKYLHDATKCAPSKPNIDARHNFEHFATSMQVLTRFNGR